jgi:hypothetical protein
MLRHPHCRLPPSAPEKLIRTEVEKYTMDARNTTITMGVNCQARSGGQDKDQNQTRDEAQKPKLPLAAKMHLITAHI